jgi:hypothetical protein
MTYRKLASFKVSAGLGRLIFCHSMDESRFIDLLDETNWSEVEGRQRFVWMPDLVLVFPYGPIAYWIDVYEGNINALDDRSYFALSVPFQLKKRKKVQFCGPVDLRQDNSVVLEAGDYRLIFQERFMTQAEIDMLPVDMIEADISEDANDPEIALGPRYCTFTFIPVEQPCEAEILKELPNSRIRRPLTLRS